jgi:hypothetical protein
MLQVGATAMEEGDFKKSFFEISQQSVEIESSAIIWANRFKHSV